MAATTTDRPAAPPSAGELVAAARAGDSSGWNQLVERYGRLVWWAARKRGLGADATADVSQVTWLRLVEHIDRLQDPERVASWLVTTASREALRRVTWDRLQPVVDIEVHVDEHRAPAPPPDTELLADERDRLVARAIAELPHRCRRLLQLLVDEEGLQYRDIADELHISIGSIGPTRGRCLECLRRSPLLAGLSAA